MSWRSKSYEVLPALSVRRRELRRSLRTIATAYMFGVAWGACVTGSQTTVFAQMLGFNDFHFGLLGAIPYMAALGQLASAVLVERTGLKKYQFVECGIAHRALWLVVAAIPLMLPVPSRLAVGALLGVLTLSWFLNALALPAGLTWLADLIPRRIRGRFLAARERIGASTQIGLVLAIGLILDLLTDPGKPETFRAQPALLYVVSAIFALAAVLGIIDLYLFRRVREVMPPPHPGAKKKDAAAGGTAVRRGRLRAAARSLGRFRRDLADLFVQPMRDGGFRRYVAYGFVLTFSMTVGGWYFWRHAMRALHFSKLATNSLFMVIVPCAGLLAAGAWGKLIDRWGHRPVLILGTAGAAVSTIPWLFLSPGFRGSPVFTQAINALAGAVGGAFGRPGWTWLDPGAPVGAYLVAAGGCVLGGTFWMAVTLAQTGVILGFSDGPGRSRYVAVSAVLLSLGGVLGGIIGGILAQSLQGLEQNPLKLGFLRWNQWQVTFAATVVTRSLAVALVTRMPDRGARGFLELLKYWGGTFQSNVTGRLLAPLRLVGKSREGDDEREGPPR